MYWDANGVGYFFPPPQPGDPNDTKAWQEFREYDKRNPQIWDEFVEQTDKVWERGFRRVGAHFIMHILRWRTTTRANTGEYKVNHNHFPYYARKYLKEFHEKEGLFELRPLTRR